MYIDGYIYTWSRVPSATTAQVYLIEIEIEMYTFNLDIDIDR